MGVVEVRESPLYLREFVSSICFRLHDVTERTCETSREGETMYSLEDAQTLRLKLAKLGESIDATSKRILVLGVQKDAEEGAPPSQEQRLYQMIRTSAMIFLKEELLTLQPLPTPEEYAALQEERQKRIEARIAYEKQLEEEQREKSKEQRKRETWNLDSGPSMKTTQVYASQDGIAITI